MKANRNNDLITTYLDATVLRGLNRRIVLKEYKPDNGESMTVISIVKCHPIKVKAEDYISTKVEKDRVTSLSFGLHQESLIQLYEAIQVELQRKGLLKIH